MTFVDREAAQTYAFAGNATLTVQSKRTGDHYTFRIRKSEDGKVYFVSLLIGGDEKYAYVGIIRNPGDWLKLTAKSRLTDTAKPIAAFNYLLRALYGDEECWGKLEVRHEGHCGRCNRPLTHPDSIDRGIGPECAKFMCQAA